MSLGFALIGCGRIAKKHAELLGSGSVSGAHLVAVCDPKEDRASKTGISFGVPHYNDMHALMLDIGDQVDILTILTESGNHATHCIEAAKYGKHIVVEKPMALELEEAKGMIEACTRRGLKLFVVKQNRFNRPVRKLMDAIDRKRFGKMVMGTVRVRWCRPQSYYDLDDWRGTKALDGGVLSNQASHHIDLLLWCMGEVESVFAKGTARLVNIESEDTAVAVLKFRSGALGIIEATTATRPKDLEGSISVLGEMGSVEIGGFAVNEMRTWNFSSPEPGDETVIRDFRENPPNVYGFGHRAYLEHVVDVINNDTVALVDGTEGQKSLQIINAIYESMDTGKEVMIKELDMVSGS